MAADTLPVRDWDALSSKKPWEVVADALAYQHAGVALPEALSDGVTQAAMMLSSVMLIKAGEATLEDCDDLWERDFTVEMSANLTEARFTVSVVFDDGQEPERVDVTVRGGPAGELMVDHISGSTEAKT